MSALLCLSLALTTLHVPCGDAFLQSLLPASSCHHRIIPHARPSISTITASRSTSSRTIVKESSQADSQAEQEAAALLEKVRKMRAEIASLEGKTVDDVEKEAEEKKATDKRRLEKVETDRVAREQERIAVTGGGKRTSRRDDGKFLSVPITAEDQVEQAARSVEDAFKDGITRQIVRFALFPEDKTLSEDIQVRNRVESYSVRYMYSLCIYA